MIQINPSKFDERLFSDIIFVQITFETRKRNTRLFLCFEAGSSRGTLQRRICLFKKVKPWPWHVEVIPGVSAVGLVTHEELCQVVEALLLRTLRMNIPLL